MNDAKLHDEPGRLAALYRYEVLDTPKEASFERITNLVKTVLNVPICAVSLIDEDRQWFKSCIGIDAPEGPRAISFCTHTIQAREPMMVRDAMQDERFMENPSVTGLPHIRSYLGVPLCTADGYNVGSLCGADTVAREFTPDQIDMLTSFAAIVVDELELRRIAQTDHLTGAATRRSFGLELEKALAQYRRSGTRSALVMLDVDHFKRINDTYGHAAGDVVLKSLAHELNGQLRLSDTLGRLGGEEFGILLRDTDGATAAEIAERFRRALEHAEIGHDPKLKITASFGLAILDDSIESSGAWMAHADAALYEAKRSGRNRCCVASAVGEVTV